MPSPAASPNWDALAVSLTSQSNAIAWGAVILGVIVALAGFAWGKIITVNAEQEARQVAEKEARETAETEVRKWLQDEGFPMVRREASEFLRTFHEQPISEDELADLVRAAGADRKAGDGGKK